MISNVGKIDRIIRLILAAGLLYLGLGVFSGSALGIGLDIVAAIAFLTGLIGFCGLYQLLGIQRHFTVHSLTDLGFNIT